MKKVNHPYLTAIKRTNLSVPTRFLKEKNLLKGRILDFGCGYGFDTDELHNQGYDIMGYDYYYRPNLPEGKFDTIICNYVLNVLEPYEQAEVMMNVTNLLKPDGTAYFAVRRDVKEEGFRLHVIHRQYTYQCNVKLPFKSLESNSNYELYQYNHFNRIFPMEDNSCPFCCLDSEVEIICETVTCVAFYDKSPISSGHALIIPKRHVVSYFNLTNHEREAMNVVLQFVKHKLDERFHPDGYNIGVNVNEVAGQSVPHVSMYIIPRYKVLTDDMNQYSILKHEMKSYTLEMKRKEHGNAYIPWEEEADKLLCRLFDEGKSIELLSEIFERTNGAIISRLRKKGKIK